MQNNIGRAATVFWVAFALCGASLAQSLAGKQVTRNYAGVGDISWSVPKDMNAIFAVPHFTTGARILCQSPRYECEVSVQARDISVSAEERLRGLEAKVKPYLPDAKDKTFKILNYGVDKSVTYTTLEDARPAQEFRFLTIGYALRGPALITFTATTNDALDAMQVLKLVDSASAKDAREMWAFRLGDYRAACAELFPAHAAENNKAFDASPFASVDVLAYVMHFKPAAPKQEAVQALAEARKGFAASLGAAPEARQRDFCSKFAQWVLEAGKDLH